MWSVPSCCLMPSSKPDTENPKPLLLVSVDIAPQDANILDQIEITYDIPYDAPPPAGGNMHTLDLYRPKGYEKTKVVFIPHSGPWFAGDKSESATFGRTFAGCHHYTTVIINFELSADPWNVKHPAHIQDLAKAFAWVYAHIAEYGGDPEKIYVFGASLGGYLGSLLATDTSRLAAEGLSTDKIKGVISMGGMYDPYPLSIAVNNPLGLDTFEITFYRTMFYNAFGNCEEATLDSGSPMKFINAGQPPFRLMYSWSEMGGFDQQAVQFHDRIKALNGPYVDLVFLEQADMPPEAQELDLPGHFAEAYAINSRDCNSRATMSVVDFIESH